MATQESIADEIEVALSFKDAADILCRRLQLPDLHTVKGLELCNNRFQIIWKKLKAQWAQNRQRSMASICVVFGKMSVDHILRNKLAKAGTIDMLIDGLKFRGLQLVALRALSIMTAHGGAHERMSVADKATGQTIVNIAKNCEADHDPLFTCCISVLCHSSFAAYGVHTDPSGTFPKLPASRKPSDADAFSLLDLMTRATKNPDHVVAGHAFQTLRILSSSEANYISRSPETVKCLVGHIRNPSLVTRLSAWVSIYNTHRHKDEESLDVDPQQLTRAAEILKKDKDYGNPYPATDSSELVKVLVCQKDYMGAMFQNAKDKDMVALGNKLYKLIMTSEWSTPEGAFQDAKGNTLTTMGLPYVYWFDSLPICAKALRDKDPKSEAAIVLDIKYLMRKRRFPEVRATAENWIKTANPECSYCYYALSIAQEDKEGLKWAKKGLRTKPQGYIRLGMLCNAIDNATNLAIVALDNVKIARSAQEASKSTAHGIAYLKSVIKDAEDYIEAAPLDDRMLRSIIAKYLGLYIAFKGPTPFSPDLRELQPLVSKLALVEKFSGIIWEPVKDTPNRATWKTIEQYHKEVADGWDSVFSRAGRTSEQDEQFKHGVPDGLEGLVENLCDDTTQPLETDETKWKTHVFSTWYDEGMVELLTCSECTNPSAQVMKCGRCGGARYCDTSCQKKAWPTHKKVCVAGPLIKA